MFPHDTPRKFLDIWGQIDTRRLSAMLGLTPDKRVYCFKHRKTGRAHIVTIRFWAFMFVAVLWGRDA